MFAIVFRAGVGIRLFLEYHLAVLVFTLLEKNHYHVIKP